MKFLCVPCDSPMKLQAIAPPEGGSLSVVYSCPLCGYEMAMLTNPYETQLVQSLGVRIGPETRDARAAASAPGPEAGLPTDDGTGRGAAPASKCPFAAMLPPVEGSAGPDRASDSLAGGTAQHVQAAQPIPIRWTSGAEARLANIPSFVRPMARTGIERFAADRGAVEVDEQVLDEAREFFGM